MVVTKQDLLMRDNEASETQGLYFAADIYKPTAEFFSALPLLPCPVPDCGCSKATRSHDYSSFYVYCPDCSMRGPRESVDSYGVRWNALPRTRPAAKEADMSLDDLRERYA